MTERTSNAIPDLPESGGLAGIFTIADLTGAGLTASRIRTLVRHGELRNVRRGVYARVAATDELAPKPGVQRPGVSEPAGLHVIRVAAAIAAVGNGCVASYRDAAAIHGLDLLNQPPPESVSVCRAPGGHPG